MLEELLVLRGDDRDRGMARDLLPRHPVVPARPLAVAEHEGGHGHRHETQQRDRGDAAEREQGQRQRRPAREPHGPGARLHRSFRGVRRRSRAARA